MSSVPLRSPRASLGGYILLPRLIDKVRLAAKGALPPEYHENLLKPGFTLDARFLRFTGLKAEAVRQAILATDSDAAVLAWVQKHGTPHSSEEKQAWAEAIAGYQPDARILSYRLKAYPGLASRIDLSTISVLDLIDMDEGRLPVPSQKESSRG